jgi:hypothetical protein
MLDHKYHGSIIAFRNDRLGARLMTMMNMIRIAQDYDIPYYFVWQTGRRTSEELLQPTQIFDETYFNALEAPIDVYRTAAKTGTDLMLMPADSTADDLRAMAAGGTPLICIGHHLIIFPWETRTDVAPRYAAAIHTLRFSPEVTAAMHAVDDVLSDSGTAFHIRRGDIIYDPITSNQLWSNKYIPREFYEVLAKQLISDPNKRVLVFSDEPEEIVRLKTLGPQILGAADVIPANLTPAQRTFIELYAMSRSSVIYGPPGSGFSMTAALMGNIEVKDVRSALDEASNHAALDLLVRRLQSHSDAFLSAGDIGQSLPFAVNHLNSTDRSGTALKMLQSYNRRGFCKMFFFKLLLRQNIIAGYFKTPAKVLKSLETAPLDFAIPRRLEGRWGELSRLSAIASAHAGDRAQTQTHITNAVWYAATRQLTMMTLAQLCSADLVDTASFAIPFDAAARRPVSSQTIEITIAREGHAALVPPGQDQPQWVMPGDLIALDWQPFLGKSLRRGFGTAAGIKRGLELLTAQFDRHIPPASIASAQGVYASIGGDHVSAEKLHTKALQLDASNPLFIKRMAASMLAVDPMNPVARILLERAANLAPDQVIYRAELANCLFTQDDKDAGLDMMQDAALTDGAVPEIAFLAARMKRQLKQTDADALALIDHALAVAPHIRRFLIMRMYIQAESGDLISAIQTSDDIIDRFGDGDLLKAWRARNIPQGA